MKKGSETKIIKRSQINLNPYNPKHHSELDIKKQKANIKRVGLLGGITWNETSGNLIDGHKRILSCDLINGYDGTPEKDYDVKVEAVDFDEKTEKEQMVFQAVANTSVDYNEIAKFIDDIDFKAAGFTEQDAEQIKQLQDDLESSLAEMEDFGNDFIKPIEGQEQKSLATTKLPFKEATIAELEKQLDEKPKMTKEEVKAEKQHCTNVATTRQTDMDTYVFIEFESTEQKLAFCELLDIIPASSMKVNGRIVLEHIE